MKKIVLLLLVAMGVFFMVYKETKKTDATLSLALAGDVMIGRLVNEAIAQKGYGYVWGDTLPLLQQHDLVMINLETTLTTHDQAVPKVFNFKSDPAHIAVLKEANVHVVSLANNHSLDFGEQGLIDTLNALDSAGIKHVGAGLNKAQARKPLIIERNSITIGILGASDNEPDWQAQEDKPGIFYFDVHDCNLLIEAVKQLRPQVDIVIMSLHWGPNMRERPTQHYIDCAHALIDAGVDIIHGHSAHIFQGIELYKNKLILYDTGDFVDDYQVDEQLRNDRSLLFSVQLKKNGVQQLKLIPVVINNMQVNRATGTEAREILERMQQLSAEFGTSISQDGSLFI